MSPIFIDIAILVLLALFAWFGGRKGLILTVFSFLAIFVALYGAQEISGRFADIIKPSIQLKIDGILEGETPEGAESILQPEADDTTESGETEEPVITRDFSLRQILTLIEEHGLYTGFQSYLDEAIRENTLRVTSTAVSAMTAYLAALIAKALLFGLSFVMILLVWFLVSRALDLAFKLPVLAALNTVGGAILGLVKGIIVVLVLVWLGKLAGWITEANTGPITGLMTAEKLSAFLRGIIAAVTV